MLRVLAVGGSVVLAGCGLLLDTDPPGASGQLDGGPARDGGQMDAGGEGDADASKEAGPDGSAGDATVDVADGDVECTSDDDCTDGVECTRDWCDEGQCVYSADDSLCTDGPGGQCDADTGCSYYQCKNECSTRNPCRVATCNAQGECVSSDACPEDDNPCTVAECRPVIGCVQDDVPDGTPCDDGNFCNGADECQNGECVGGNPVCNGGACDEDKDRCTTCSEDSDCATVAGAWSSCRFDNACTESGTRTRDVRSFECVSGTCELSSVTPETETCTRDTSVIDSCGDTVRTAWSQCTGFDGPCDQTGEQTRQVTRHQCIGGSCVQTTTTESRECTRDTDGASCDDGQYCNGADTCRAGTCDEHEGSPCLTGETCAEDSDRCLVACDTNRDCRMRNACDGCGLGLCQCAALGGCLCL